MTLPPLAAYVHLPWCVRKCPYCDFNSHPQREDSDFATYTDALLADLRWAQDQFPRRPLRSIFFGGGTPSLCPPAQIERILRALESSLGFARGIEITLEANPGTADAGHFAGYRAAGVNRLSVGVQSFDNDMLRKLGRIHDSGQAVQAVQWARRAGFDNLNIDLMHGLPGQTVAGALDDLQQAIALQPEHLSWYELTLEPQTEFARRPPVLPAEDTLAGIETAGARLLRRSGFRAYEVSAWAQADRCAQHNLNYWRYGDFLGLGAGAHSKLTLADGSRVREVRQRAPARYLSCAGSTVNLTQRTRLTAADLIAEFTLNGLRLHAGVSLQQFAQRTGLDPALLAPGIRAGKAQGLLRPSATRLIPTALGRRHLNTLLAGFASPPAAE